MEGADGPAGLGDANPLPLLLIEPCCGFPCGEGMGWGKGWGLALSELLGGDSPRGRGGGSCRREGRSRPLQRATAAQWATSPPTAHHGDGRPTGMGGKSWGKGGEVGESWEIADTEGLVWGDEKGEHMKKYGPALEIPPLSTSAMNVRTPCRTKTAVQTEIICLTLEGRWALGEGKISDEGRLTTPSPPPPGARWKWRYATREKNGAAERDGSAAAAFWGIEESGIWGMKSYPPETLAHRRSRRDHRPRGTWQGDQ